ncbi:nucleoside-triphosphate diphosphatase [Endozoicomonas montiporae]|uniref:dITP/XTP pyrophosphatase n=2 Tax=Endozoicomonas montiporae TaxID=1027273 RepID=A0A081MZM4_9GAMM|nr:RdgB/HAM1 family non-canonical purine NTP pyrophosphatase [Endozoicomonas montiporae]AMO54667.1 Ham1-like protein [Endozoicomonas montiporae CL-33]KEQ11647.1 nucleoside-triphosphate diphosphatase [Endozoicomonas montiporae]
MSGERRQIVLASGNQGKLKEFQHLLSNLNIDMLPQSQFNVDSVEETGLTFVENAILKARHAAKISGLPAIADDSGIEVDALNGQPGIYSARYAGEGATDAENNARLLKNLEGLEESQRTARFHCVLVYLRHADDPTPLVCHGSWEGCILEASSGDHGFGYDPLFFVPSEGCSAADLPKDVKNSISHRAVAMSKLAGLL